MAPPPYSNGFARPRTDDSSVVDDLRALVAHTSRSLWRFAKGRGRLLALAYLMQAARQLRRNLTARRLLSFPHAVVAVWIFVLLWGERWIFHSKVEKCHWESWERWVRVLFQLRLHRLQLANYTRCIY